MWADIEEIAGKVAIVTEKLKIVSLRLRVKVSNPVRRVYLLPLAFSPAVSVLVVK